MSVMLRPEAAAELSRELRESTDPRMERRRGMMRLLFVATGALGMVAAYQVGLIKRLPEPPLPLLDADKVDASPEAYQKLATPDAVLGVGSYAATMGLVAMGGVRRAEEHPWIPLALAAKVAVDVAMAARLTVVQWTHHRAYCSWCLLAAGATFGLVPLVLPEVREVLRRRDGGAPT